MDVTLLGTDQEKVFHVWTEIEAHTASETELEAFLLFR